MVPTGAVQFTGTLRAGVGGADAGVEGLGCGRKWAAATRRTGKNYRFAIIIIK